MTKYAVFLRGVNVGGRIIKMADLRACLEKAGFQDVKTVLQSGNVIISSELSAAKLRQQIEAILASNFNYPAKVQIVSTGDLQAIVDANPFNDAADDYHQYVIFFDDTLNQAFAQEAAQDTVRSGQRVVYWKVRKGETLKDPVGKLLAKPKYRQHNTNRNIRTLRKILAL